MPWEEDVPSWAGPVGKTLQDAALGFTTALLDLPKERLARQKDELELDRLRSQIALDKANAVKAARYGEEGDVIKAGGRLYRKNPLTGKYEFEAGKSLTDVPKPMTPGNRVKAQGIAAAEDYFGKPFSEFSTAEFTHPKWQDYADVIFGRSDVLLGPDGMPLARTQVRRDANGQPLPEPTPPRAATPAPAGQEPAAGTATGGGAGNLGQRHNNPYNIKYGEATRHWVEDGLAEIGDPATDKGHFLRFKDPFVGDQAGRELLTGPKYRHLTVEQAMRQWSGQSYGADVAPGVPGDKPVSALSQRELNTLLAAMRDKEGWNAKPAGQVAGPGAPAPAKAAPAARPAPAVGPPAGQPPPPTAASTPEEVQRYQAWQAQQQPPAPQADHPAGPGTKASAPDPRVVKHYADTWQPLERAEVDRRWQLYEAAPGQKGNTAQRSARAEAYKQLYGAYPEGYAPAGTMPPSSSTPAAPTVTRTPSTGTVPTPAPREGQTVQPQYITPAKELAQTGEAQRQQIAANQEARAQTGEGREEEKLQLQKEEQARLTRNAERAAALDVTLRPTEDQNRVTNDLFVGGKVNPASDGFYPLLDPFEKKMVNDIIQQPIIAKQVREQAEEQRKQENQQRAMRKEHRDAMKVVAPFFQELDALDTTAYLTRQIIPLVETMNLGVMGRLTQYEKAMGQFLPGRQQELMAAADAMMKKKGYNDNIDKTAGKLGMIALVESRDPAARALFDRVGGQAKLQTLSSILVYAHALAVKRIAGGTARGLTHEDVRKAEALFDVNQMLANPTALLANLNALQGFIQDAREKINENIRMNGINPDTQRLMIRDVTDTPGAKPLQEVDKPTAPAPVSTEDLDLLRRGRKAE